MSVNQAHFPIATMARVLGVSKCLSGIIVGATNVLWVAKKFGCIPRVQLRLRLRMF